MARRGRAELVGEDVLRAPAHPLRDVRAIDPDLPALGVDAAHDDVRVRVVGVVVIDGAPLEPQTDVALDVPHEVARELRQVDVVLRRDDEPELMALAWNGVSDRRAIDLVSRAVEAALGSVALDAVALDVGEVQPGRLHAPGVHRHDARLDDAAAGVGARPQDVRHAARARLPRRSRPPERGDLHEPDLRPSEHGRAEVRRPLERNLPPPTADSRPERALLPG
jgi:hypothetical protein